MNWLILFFTLWPTHHEKNPVIRVEDHYAREEVLAFSEWLSQELLLDATCFIKIKFSKDLPQNKAGVTLYARSGSTDKPHHQVLIYVTMSMHTTTTLKVLAHEFVHAAQHVEGRFIENANGTCIWEGTLYESPRSIPYHKRGWEAEAIHLAEELYDRYRAEKELLL
jgi:hypothetical protein